MNPIKKKLADSLTKMTKRGIEAMDAESPCAKSLEGADVDALLQEDIQHICSELSTIEAGKILKLAVKRKLSSPEDADMYKKAIESMASEIVKRVEKRTGSLNLPLECRQLLMNL